MMRRLIVGFAIATTLPLSVASAQFERRERLTAFYVTSSRLDPYGNAQADSPLRRSLDLYQNDAQRAAARLYQNAGRRQQQRGSLIPFSLPADRFRRNQRSRDTTPVVPFAVDQSRGVSGSERLRAFRAYGGFSARSAGRYGSEVQRAFARRYDLVTATANTAPVFRANMRHASVAGMLTTIDMTPFDDRGLDLEGRPGADLGAALARNVKQSQKSLVRDAWGWFKDGAYRRAERAFESADVLEPGDMVSRIGQFFSLLGLGATRTARSVLYEINQRDPNPFLYPLNVADILGDRRRAALLRVQTQMPSDAPRENPDLAAMRAFALWYLGERQEALSVAQAIADESPGSPYEAWVSKMTASIAADAGVANQP